jgi:hypothetical protein
MKELDKYLREIQQLDSELQHIDALLRMHGNSVEKSESNAGQISYFHILYSHNNKKIPSGIARHVLAMFAEDNKPLPINTIHQRLKERGINTSMSGVNTALRRNPSYFEQVEKFFWRLKTLDTHDMEQQGEKTPVENEEELVTR